ncbi:serine/threonine-protein kinase [Pseudonocardia sp.]|jgi:hypothetical protein|uniref:serine/threonine-protein kinase n=1 Tax=Pseudonocardia sp. TaxID=60912 RepID=UPI0031FE145C
MDLVADDPRSLGRYRVVARLGSGGMGRVLLGVDDAGRRAALKVVHPHVAAEPGFRDRFRREVQLVAMAPPWFTAAVLDADPDGDPPWLATAFVEGPSLHAYVAANGPLSRQGTVALAVRMADGLVALHGTGLAHGDLKPSNVLLAEDGPRLIDGGISRAVDPATAGRPGPGPASPEFMSPEYATGQDIGPASDIFSLGSLIGFAAMGRSPFAADSAARALHRVTHGEPDLAAHIDGPLRDGVLACLSKDPAARPTAAWLRDLLRSLDQPDPVAAASAIAVGAGLPVAVPFPATRVAAPAGPATHAGPAGLPTLPAPAAGPAVATSAGPPMVPAPRLPIPAAAAAGPAAVPAPADPARTAAPAGRARVAAPAGPITATLPVAASPVRDQGLHGRNWSVVAAIVVAAVAGAGLAVAVVLLLRGPGTAPDPVGGPSGTAPSVNSAGSADPTGGVDVIDGETDSRFGTGAAQFATPSGNIACRMSTGEVRCDVVQRTWQLPPTPTDCSQAYGTGAVLVGSGPGQLSCVGDTVAASSLPVLAYGKAVRFDGVVCVSRESGIRCENSETRHGFGVARASYDLF